MLTEHIQGTVKNVQSLVANLKTFYWLITNLAGSALSRINTAIREINKMAKNDLNRLREVSNECKEAYDFQLAITVDSALHYLKVLDLALRSDNKESAHVNNTLHTVHGYLEDMKKIKEISPVSKNEDWVPDRFWRDDMGLICRDAYTEMANNIYTSLRKEAENDRDKEAHLLHSYKGSETISSVIRCTNEYKIVVEDTARTISSHFEEANEAVENDFYFTYDKILDIVSDDLNYITKLVSYLEDMLVRYSTNDTTKLYMSSSITKSSRTYLEEKLDGVLSRLITRAVVPLQTMTKNSEVNIKKWLHSSLSALGMLFPYFDNNYRIDKKARKMTIWRYPVLKMNSNKMLQYKYDQREKWITWPGSNNILEMLERGDYKTIFTEILTSYGNDLSIEIYKLQSQFIIVKKDILRAFDNLMDDVQSFRRQSEIDKGFVA